MTRKEELETEEQELYEKLNKIKSEKEEIEQKELEEKRKKVAKKIQFLRDNKDVVLALLQHGRTSCSDDNPWNGYECDRGYARCDKCFLIEILNGEWGDGEFDVSFSVNIVRTSLD